MPIWLTPWVEVALAVTKMGQRFTDLLVNHWRLKHDHPSGLACVNQANDECRVLRLRVPVYDAIVLQAALSVRRNFPAHLADEGHRRSVISCGLNAPYFQLSRDARRSFAIPQRKCLQDPLLGWNYPIRCMFVVARHEHRHVALRSSLRFRCMRGERGDARHVDPGQTASARALGLCRRPRRLMGGPTAMSVARRTCDQEARNSYKRDASEAL